MPIKMLLADDSAIVRQAIARVLTHDPELELIAESSCFSQTIELAHTMQAEVIVMDLHMGDEQSMTASHIKSSLHNQHVLAMSVWIDNETKALAESFGAVCLLNKSNLYIELIPAIKAASRRSRGA